MSQSISFGVIGAGKLGISLIKKLNSTGDLKWIIARSSESKYKVKNFAPNSLIYNFIQEIKTQADCIFICTDDKSLRHVIDDISRNRNINHQRIIYIHCSGAYGTEIFEPLSRLGAGVAACHPYQTFFSESEESFENIAWGIECSDDIYLQSKLIISSLGGIPERITKDINKPLYHLSAVAASNLMAASIQLAKLIAIKAGIHPDIFMPEILKTTLENNIKSLANETFPLTGPVAREDLEVIKSHLLELAPHQDLREAYLNMIRATSSLAFSHSLISESFYNEIKKL
jgi:predicted short-subunit dehydrogenase-like oxidoreductase (DUF2520 family)